MSEQPGTTRTTPQVAVPSVVWGVIVLVIAGVAFAGSFVNLRDFTAADIVFVVIGVGVLLVLSAIIGAVVRAVGVSTGSTTESSEPAQSAEPATDTASTDRLTDL